MIKLIKDARKLRKSKRCKSNIVPYGASYIDLLPDDIMYELFKTKHSMEDAPTLEMVKKFKCVSDEEPFNTRIPIRTLLSPITRRKMFHIDAEKYEGDIEFKAAKETLKSIEAVYNVTINLKKPNDPLSMYSSSDEYTDA